jgi:hypothetical protein
MDGLKIVTWNPTDYWDWHEYACSTAAQANSMQNQCQGRKQSSACRLLFLTFQPGVWCGSDGRLLLPYSYWAVVAFLAPDLIWWPVVYAPVDHCHYPRHRVTLRCRQFNIVAFHTKVFFNKRIQMFRSRSVYGLWTQHDGTVQSVQL